MVDSHPHLRSTRPTLLAATTAISVLLLGSCDAAPASPRQLDAGDIRPLVTPAVAAAMTPDGRFAPAPIPPEPYPQIGPERAAELALAWARSFGRFHGLLEVEHGRKIDFGSLEIGSPAYYATPAFEPAPPHVHPGIRNVFGPYYLVYLVSGGTPVLSVGVAAHTQSWVKDGELFFPVDYGNDFRPGGVHVGKGFSMPLSPEQAARSVAAATGARVAAAPELLLPHPHYYPQYARWRIELDRAVPVRNRATGKIGMVREIYVGFGAELSVPAELQPESHRGSDPSRRERFMLARRPGRPAAFDLITPAPVPQP